MNEKTIMAVPKKYFYIVTAICILGIIIGSFLDYDINVALANKTDIGAFFATYGSYFSYCLYPAAGMCIFKGSWQHLTSWRFIIAIIITDLR